MKNIAILEITPEQPSQEHINYFCDNSLCDYYFVTYKKENENAIGFNYYKSWAYNRNQLYEHVKNNYEYYFFIDYDITFNLENPVEYIHNTLFRYNPVMYRPSGFKDDLKKEKGIYQGGFINHSVTILHKDVCDYIFPLPTQFGGFWDAASWINTVIVPVYNEYVLVDYNIKAYNNNSDNYIHNKKPNEGKKAMQKAYNFLSNYFTNKIPSYKNVNDFKKYYMNKIKPFDNKKLDFSSIDINEFISIEKMKEDLYE